MHAGESAGVPYAFLFNPLLFSLPSSHIFPRRLLLYGRLFTKCTMRRHILHLPEVAMDILQQKKTFDLLYDFFVRGKNDPSRIPYVPGKSWCYDGKGVPNFFPRVAPEDKGVSSEELAAFLRDLERSTRVNMHAITVLCDGAVICEASVPPYNRAIPHLTHSMCKSITGLAIGLLYDEGRVDTERPAYQYFAGAQLPGRLSARIKAVTVRHLLTMTSGVSFNEAAAAVEVNWVRAFFSSDVKFTPGSNFAYNSLNTYILSALVRNVTGVGLTEYLRSRLFGPLGIRDIFWEKCPLGIEKGGWGLYIAQEDIAKIGQLCLDRGVFAGRRLISEKWLDQACSFQIATPEDSGDFDYGYQIWVARNRESYLFNGMLGQNTWICPRNRFVIVANAGNSEFFQKGSMLAIFEKYFGASYRRTPAPLPSNRKALHRLRSAESRFFSTRAWIQPLHKPSLFSRMLRQLRGRPLYPLPPLCRKLNGLSYRFPHNNAGLLPTFVRIMQNNYSAGVRGISFRIEENHFFFTFDEGEGAIYKLEAGFYDPIPDRLMIRGESYRVAVRAGFAVDEDGHRLLKIDLSFLELPHARRIKVFFDEECPRLLLREVPGREVLDGLLRTLPISAPRTRGILHFIQNRLNLDYILLKIYEKFEPRLVPQSALTDDEGAQTSFLLPEEADPDALLPASDSEHPTEEEAFLEIR